MIAAVLFDLFETLITESQLQPTRAGSLAAELGLEHMAYRMEWKARRALVRTGAMSFGDALHEISRTLTGRSDAAAVQRICDQRVLEKATAYARMDGAVATLIADLARAGVRLGVVSNAFAEDMRGWAGCALAPAFHFAAFSCEEGVAKPDPEIYRRAVQRLGVTPEATVYIGDGGDNELAGAEHAGLRALRAAWFVPGSAQPGRWPELARPGDVLSLLAR